jgi:hypothetical protein
MLGYMENDLDEMIAGIQAAIEALNQDENNEEVLVWLNKTLEFLQALWDKGYFEDVQNM